MTVTLTSLICDMCVCVFDCISHTYTAKHTHTKWDCQTKSYRPTLFSLFIHKRWLHTYNNFATSYCIGICGFRSLFCTLLLSICITSCRELYEKYIQRRSRHCCKRINVKITRLPATTTAAATIKKIRTARTHTTK